MDNSVSSKSVADPALDTALSTAMQQATLSELSTIETLPNEVLHVVLSKLSLPDLKAFRLTSNALTKSTLEHIFKYIRIIIHPRSTLRFAKIANNQEFRKCVRTLSFDLRMTWQQTMTYSVWYSRCLQIAQKSCPRFDFNLHGDYDSYVNFVEGQNTVATSGISAVCAVFKDFPMIQHLELTGGTDHGAQIPTTQDFVDFTTIWPKVGLAPHRNGNMNSQRHIVEVLTAALSHRESLSSLSLVGLNWDFVKFATVAQKAQWCGQLDTIRHLKLRLCLPNPNPGTLSFFNEAALVVDDYAQLIVSPTRLETLDFGLLVEPNRERKEMPWTWYGYEEDLFKAILARPSFMRHIQEIRFSEFVFSPNDFIRLLSHNEERTLKSLTFHKAHLSEGSWLVFLRQLAHAADLEYFSLSGWISSRHEGWNALTQEEVAAYYGNDTKRLHPCSRDVYDYQPDCLVNCDGFKKWVDAREGLEERWCIRAMIEDWVTSGGGTRRDLKTSQEDDPTKWAGWSSAYNKSSPQIRFPNSWNEDSFPLMQGYLPACAVHHTPTPERQKQYRYESRWRTRLDRDFTFVWAEDLMRSVRGGGRDWQPCPHVDDGRTSFCPGKSPEDDYVVDEEMVYEDKEEEFVVYRDHFIVERSGD